MANKEIKERLEKLKKEINYHRYNFAVLDHESISQAALDSLKMELYRLENQYPELITPDSPTQRVAGEPLAKFKKALHSRPMISLFDAFSEDDMRAWQERNENYLKRSLNEDYYCEMKLDGLAISLKYEKGLLITGITRGDGKIGENVTDNIKTINSIPLALRIPSLKELTDLNFSAEEANIVLDLIENGIIEARGEAIMNKKVFNELNEKYKKDGKAVLANTRNAVAGSIRQLDSKITNERKLDFYAYDLLLGNLERGKIVEQKNVLDKLANLLGFRTLTNNSVCRNLEEVFLFFKTVEKKRETLAFDIDGVVVKINNLKMWDVLGIVGKAPRYMMAYKFSAEQATTKVNEIIWQVGRTGALTPIAVLEPVKVGGAVISRSTLHNFDEIKRLDLRLGDTVIIERSGDVIPKVISVLKNLRSGKEKEVFPPEYCPRCEGKVSRIDDEVAYRCLNKNCYAVSLRQISHFVSKGALDFDGLGPKLIEQFLSSALIKDAADLYLIKKTDLLSLERFAEKKADNVIALIKLKKEIELARFIYALGIRHVGEETANLLADKIKAEIIQKSSIFEIGELIKYFQKIKLEELEALEDVGPIVARSIYKFWRDEHNIKLLKKFIENGLTTKLDVNNGGEVGEKFSKLLNKSFVLTGTMESLTRDKAKDRIKVLGGKTKETLSKDIDYLVVGENAGSKLDKADKLGIKVISELEFLKMIKND